MEDRMEAPSVVVAGIEQRRAYAARKALADHLADEHNVWLTRAEFGRSSLEALQALDPCKAEQ